MEYFQMIMALLGVLALVFLLFWAMKKLNRRVTLSDSKNMKILERINLGPDKMLLLVSVAGNAWILGVTNGGWRKSTSGGNRGGTHEKRRKRRESHL